MLQVSRKEKRQALELRSLIRKRNFRSVFHISQPSQSIKARKDRHLSQWSGKCPKKISPNQPCLCPWSTNYSTERGARASGMRALEFGAAVATVVYTNLCPGFSVILPTPNWLGSTHHGMEMPKYSSTKHALFVGMVQGGLKSS